MQVFQGSTPWWELLKTSFRFIYINISSFNFLQIGPKKSYLWKNNIDIRFQNIEEAYRKERNVFQILSKS